MHYLKVPHLESHLFSNDEFWDTISTWSEMPLAELRKESETAKGKRYAGIVAGNSVIIQDLERAPVANGAIGTFRSGIASIGLSLFRRFSRRVTWQGSWPLGRGCRSPTASMTTPSRPFRPVGAGRHVGHGVFLVQELVGCAIVMHMAKQVETLIQQPGARKSLLGVDDASSARGGLPPGV